MSELITANLFLTKLTYSALAGITTYLSFVIGGNSWVKNIHHYLTFIILPPITCAITLVISGNLALSLGMVGALSIVRFRNPVRSPLELGSYFFLITIGIVFNVKIELGFIFLIFFNSIILISSFCLYLFNKSIFVKKSEKIFGFTKTKTLELNFEKRIEQLEMHPNLLYSSKVSADNHVEYIYRIKIKKDENLKDYIKLNPISYSLFNNEI